VGALVGAQSERARRVALRQLHGGLGNALGDARSACIGVLAEVEARLDFPDEELMDLPLDRLILRLETVSDQLDALLAQAPAGRLAREGARVVLLGRPNVGKSSLLNALVGRDRAIVHPTPGTTRDWLEDDLSLGGLQCTIVDTAGQRSDADPAELLGARTALDQARHADLVLLVINLVEGMTPADRRLLEELRELKVKDVAVVLNQRDLVDQKTADQIASDCPEVLACTSATTQQGVPALREALGRRFDVDRVAYEELPLVSEKRHEEALGIARDRVQAARQGLVAGDAEELVALDLREATITLGTITGEGVTEDVLEQIFSRFCIGK
jgi:tRNA modification GTPase